MGVSLTTSRLGPALCLFGLVAAWPTAALAAFIGDPVPEAQRSRFHHSLTVDQSQRDLVTSRFNSPVSIRNVGLVARESYGLVGWGDVLINVHVMFGVARARIDFGAATITTAFWETYAPNTGNTGATRNLEFNGNFGARYGGGIKARLFEWRGFEIGGGAQLTYSENADVGLPALRLRYNEWDVNFGASLRRRYIGLYMGADLSWVVGELSTPDPNVATDLDQDDLIGAYAGMTLRFYRHLHFATEFRFINQSSLSLQLLYHF